MTPAEELYSEYFNDVYKYSYALSGDKTVAEEVTSDAFFKAINNMKLFRGECDIRVWLCKIAKNCYYSYLKKNRRFTDIDDISEIQSGDSFTEKVGEKESALLIHKALHELEEPYKEVFSLRVFGELSFKEIGALFGKSEHWSCVTFHRAKEKIRSKTEGLI